MEREKKRIDYSEISQERIITIADLIKEIVRRLWLVIIAAIIFAALLGGYKYVKDSKAASVQTDTEDITSHIASDLNEDEQNAVNNVLLIQDNMEQQQEYAENSILMQIDPYNESTVTLQYFFDAGQTAEANSQDYSNNLLNLYQSYVNNGTLISDLVAGGAALDTQYLGELISCEVQSNAAMDNAANAIVLDDQTTAFDIKVVHVDEESCRDLADRVKECMQAYQLQLNETVRPHELTLMDEAYTQVVDRDLWTYKYDRVNSIVSMQEKIETLKENFSAEQLNIVEQYTEQTLTDADEESGEMMETAEPSVSISKKYVAVGGAAGIVLACLFIIISYIMRGTINKAEDLQYLYNVRILGEVNLRRRKNVFLSLWNRIIQRDRKEMTSEEQMELLCTNLQITCEKNQIHKLLLCGADKKDLEYIKTKFDHLEDCNIQIEYVSDLLHSPQSLKKLSDFAEIVIVEKVRQSQYSDIVKEIEICSEQEVDILGAIVLEA